MSVSNTSSYSAVVPYITEEGPDSVTFGFTASFWGWHSAHVAPSLPDIPDMPVVKARARPPPSASGAQTQSKMVKRRDKQRHHVTFGGVAAAGVDAVW